MGQRHGRVRGLLFLMICAIGIGSGCDNRSPGDAAAPQEPSTRPRVVTVASLVPAATDLILGMNAGESLVAVSNFEPDRAETRDLPRVGDYRTIDWEKLIAVRPDLMIVQYRQDKMPPGLADRARELDIEIVNVALYRLDDVYTTLHQLGEALQQPEKAAGAMRRLRGQLQAVQEQVAGHPRVRTMLSMSNPLFVAGGGTVLDDVLSIAGGENVVGGEFNSYPTLDREQVLALNPDVVLNLMPAAPEQDLAENREFWDSMPNVSAVEQGRVYQLTRSDLLLHGYGLGEIAAEFAAKLHPDVDLESVSASSQPATAPTKDAP